MHLVRACVAGCPVADWSEERLDPSRMVRLIQYDQGDLLAEQNWIWQCTSCGKCTYTCPSGVDLASIIDCVHGLVDPDISPGPGQIQKTADLHRDVSNNMGLTVADWLETVEWMKDELADEIPTIQVPIEQKEALYFATINSKLPMYYPVDLQDIFKIFHAAGVDWTLPEEWWEGTN